MKDFELFKFLCDNVHRYVYCESFVNVVGSKDDGWNIKEVDGTTILLGSYHEDGIDVEIKQIENIDVEKEGWYMMYALFQIDYDGDEWQTWSMLMTTQIEFVFQITDEELKLNP